MTFHDYKNFSLTIGGTTKMKIASSDLVI